MKQLTPWTIECCFWNPSIVVVLRNKQKNINICLSLFASIVKCCSAGRWYRRATTHQILLTPNRVFYVFHTICQHVLFKLTCFVHLPPLPSFVLIKRVWATPSTFLSLLGKGFGITNSISCSPYLRENGGGAPRECKLTKSQFYSHIYENSKALNVSASICLSNISQLWILSQWLI